MSRILLVRMDGFGDALALTPLLAALRDAGHFVGAVLGTLNRDAFASTALGAVHVLERIPWPRHGSTRQSYMEALAQARNLGYDVALVASEEPEAYRFAREAHVAARTGFTNGLEKPFKSAWVRTQLTRALYRPASAARERVHEVETLFALGEGLHRESAPTHLVQRLRPLVLETPVATGDHVVVQVSAKFGQAGLGGLHYSRILIALAARFPTFALCSREDEAFARAACAPAGVPVDAGLDTSEWKVRLASARAVVTPDSGAAHVAGMCGVPCVDLFAATPHFASDVVRWRPWASPARTLSLASVNAAALAASVCSSLEALLASPAIAP